MNPVAGIGARLALKESDGELGRKAKSVGEVSPAPRKTVETLKEISHGKIDFVILTYPSAMGENEAIECGYHPMVMGQIQEETTGQDTKRAARDMIKHGADLILFAGGDGTALDLLQVVGDAFPILGIPSGVKMHSGLFAINPALAGWL